jgi:hypothetical protein
MRSWCRHVGQGRVLQLASKSHLNRIVKVNIFGRPTRRGRGITDSYDKYCLSTNVSLLEHIYRAWRAVRRKSLERSRRAKPWGASWAPGPGTKTKWSFMGTHSQSSTKLGKLIESGATRCHHVAEVHKRTIIVDFEPCFFNFLQIFPITLKGGWIHQVSTPQLKLKQLIPDNPLHQWSKYNFKQRLFSFEENRSQECGSHRLSSMLKYPREIEKSSGISHLDISSAMAFSSRGTHSMAILILNSRQNQKSSPAKTFYGSLELPRLMIPKRFIASVWRTTNLSLHWATTDWRQRVTPKSSR